MSVSEKFLLIFPHLLPQQDVYCQLGRIILWCQNNSKQAVLMELFHWLANVCERQDALNYLPVDQLLRAGGMLCCTLTGQCPSCFGDPRAGCSTQGVVSAEQEGRKWMGMKNGFMDTGKGNWNDWPWVLRSFFTEFCMDLHDPKPWVCPQVTPTG